MNERYALLVAAFCCGFESRTLLEALQALEEGEPAYYPGSGYKAQKRASEDKVGEAVLKLTTEISRRHSAGHP